MAIPQIPELCWLQWMWQGPSGLPEDVYVNVWYFKRSIGNTADEGDLQNALARLEDSFWNVSGASGGAMSSRIPSSLGAPRVKGYLGADGPGRTPKLDQTATTTPSGPVLPLPAEVALCLSYYSDSNTPRKRGRLYLGPFTSESNEAGNGTQLSKPTDGLVANMVAAAESLVGANGNVDLSWAQFSPTDGLARTVTAGWVDTAWDTQRRRGAEATGRTTWTSAA